MTPVGHSDPELDVDWVDVLVVPPQLDGGGRTDGTVVLRSWSGLPSNFSRLGSMLFSGVYPARSTRMASNPAAARPTTWVSGAIETQVRCQSDSRPRIPPKLQFSMPRSLKNPRNPT